MSFAQGYPERPITVIVPFSAGGGSDNIARLIVAKLSEKTGKTFIIDNRAGGGTNIGNELAARANPDGYTLLLGQFTLSVNPYLYRSLRYKTDAFVPVVHIANAPSVLVVPANSPIKDVPGLIAAAKANPGKLNFGSGGAGTSVHLAGELFKLSTKTDLMHVPYKGSAPAMTDLIGGQIQMMFDTSTSALAFVKGGKVRAVATAADSRLKGLPNVPTFAEQGLKDFDVPAWYGFVAPAGFPDTAAQWINAQVNTVLKDPALVTQLEGIGAIRVGGTPQQMATFMKTQATRWERVIKDSNIKLD
ncbi:tripartite tricarboxylate transporter substrate binding protein [Comamonas sp. Tr-654]|nr:tripartite tricarboxylate transporter substrate binding protein [Comamonas sp. Tr-654]NIF82662.1 tripartite tricarboxylate transporter substrate binding protein [Comamonas sp. Tr-654]